MIGDTPHFQAYHTVMADHLFEAIRDKLALTDKVVVAIGGGSGSGKSETSALLADRAEDMGLGVYVLSCDNYPHLPPRDNEARREELFNEGGEAALQNYLGTQNEIDFARLEKMVAAFKSGETSTQLRIIDNPGNKIADNAKELDLRAVNVLVLEGTWSNKIAGIDVPVFIVTTPEETRAHREKRGRDPLTEVGETVVRVEQAALDRVKQEKAQVLLGRDGSVSIQNR